MIDTFALEYLTNVDQCLLSPRFSVTSVCLKMWSLVTVFEILVFLGGIHFWIKNRLSYWKRNGVCSVKPKYLFGNMKKAGRRHFSEITEECYRKLKHKDVIGGFYFFLQPKLLLFKPTLIGHVLTSDSSYFEDRHIYQKQNGMADKSPNLLVPEGQRAKELRAKITPSPTLMTTAKLKAMFDSKMLQVGSELEKCIDERARKGGPIDIKDLCSRFSSDMISRCVFGMENKSLQDPNNEFWKKSLKLVEPTIKKWIRSLFTSSFVDLSRILGVQMVDEYLTGIIKEKALQQKGNDMLRLLLDEIEKQNHIRQLPFEAVCAETLLSVTSALGSTATTMRWCIYELAKSPLVQEKLIDEVQRVLTDNRPLCYDTILEMRYLEQVVLGE